MIRFESSTSFDPFASRLILLCLDQKRHFAPSKIVGSKYSEVLNFQSDNNTSLALNIVLYRVVFRNNSFPSLAVNSVSRGKGGFKFIHPRSRRRSWEKTATTSRDFVDERNKNSVAYRNWLETIAWNRACTVY